MLVVEIDLDSVPFSETAYLQPFRGLVCPPTLISISTSTAIGAVTGNATGLISLGPVVGTGGTRAVMEGSVILREVPNSTDGKARRDSVDWELVIALEEVSEVVEALNRLDENSSTPKVIVGVGATVCEV